MAAFMAPASYFLSQLRVEHPPFWHRSTVLTDRVPRGSLLSLEPRCMAPRRALTRLQAGFFLYPSPVEHQLCWHHFMVLTAYSQRGGWLFPATPSMALP